MKKKIPTYHGQSWLNIKLPQSSKDWSYGGHQSIELELTQHSELIAVLQSLNQSQAWSWPARRHYFFSDLHGDPNAFAASLVASGGVKKRGPKPDDFILSASGQAANFIIGGDCFDKGPSSLGLLRTIQCLKKQGARVRILAGNHDVRVMFGMLTVSNKKQVSNEHFFIRTGEKIIPLLKELWNDCLKQNETLQGIPDHKECRRRLYPRKSWHNRFPQYAKATLSNLQIERELQRIQKKRERFEDKCKSAGLNLRQVYAAVQNWKKRFLWPDEEFSWFYKHMRLAYRSGSLLFIHAGLDDHIAQLIHKQGIKALNHIFRDAVFKNPFDFYYGPLCNTIRTKYRTIDYPFTQKGAEQVRRAGISALIHGHRNHHHGQRIALRQSLLHFECDSSLDKNTRKKEGVSGLGAAVTIIEPCGQILGISSDYPYIKRFEPQKTLAQIIKKMRNNSNETK